MLVGIDGCKSGWIAVVDRGAVLRVEYHASAAQAALAYAEARVVCVDIPIGLSDSGSRKAEIRARKILGHPRSSSVFPAPLRATLSCNSRLEADCLRRSIEGKGVSAQAWAIVSKIAEWDALLRFRPDLHSRVREIHPEVCFAMMNGGSGLRPSKATEEGQRLRVQLLIEHFGPEPIAELLSAVDRRRAQADDLLDATAALWTAQRIAAGTARSLPDPVVTDSMGLPMAIWY